MPYLLPKYYLLPFIPGGLGLSHEFFFLVKTKNLELFHYKLRTMSSDRGAGRSSLSPRPSLTKRGMGPYGLVTTSGLGNLTGKHERHVRDTVIGRSPVLVDAEWRQMGVFTRGNGAPWMYGIGLGFVAFSCWRPKKTTADLHRNTRLVVWDPSPAQRPHGHDMQALPSDCSGRQCH